MENILFAMDADASEVTRDALPGVSFLEVIKECVRYFVFAKSRVDRRHKFGLAALTDGAAWASDGFSSSPDALLAALDRLQPGGGATASSSSSLSSSYGAAAPGAGPPQQQPQQAVSTPSWLSALRPGQQQQQQQRQATSTASTSGGGSSSSGSGSPGTPLDLGSLVELVAGCRLTHESERAKVRVILLYARSRCVPVWCKLRPPTGASGGGGAARTGLRIDALYVHESPQPGVNRPQEVYAGVEELVDSMAAGAGHAAYIFEAGGGNVKKALAHTASLLAHPQQRPPQQQLSKAPVDLLAEGPPAAATAAAAAAPAPVLQLSS